MEVKQLIEELEGRVEEARAKGVEDDTADRRAKQEMNDLEFVQTTALVFLGLVKEGTLPSFLPYVTEYSVPKYFLT